MEFNKLNYTDSQLEAYTDGWNAALAGSLCESESSVEYKAGYLAGQKADADFKAQDRLDYIHENRTELLSKYYAWKETNK